MTWEQTTVPLKHPVEVKDEEGASTTLTEITLKMPNGRGLREIDKLGLDRGENAELDFTEIMAMIEIFGRDHPTGFSEEMHPADIKASGEALVPLLLALNPQKADPTTEGRTTTMTTAESSTGSSTSPASTASDTPASRPEVTVVSEEVLESPKPYE